MLVEARGVCVRFRAKTGVQPFISAVDCVDLVIREGETLGLVGESGSGKSTLGMTLLGFHKPNLGEVRYRGENIQVSRRRQGRQLCRLIQAIFQDPLGSLNPRRNIGSSLEAPLRAHGLVNSRYDAKQKALKALERVGLDETHYYRYPHELSGGQLQRVCIARALQLGPEFIVADEPVSSLDVSVQAQVLNLFREIQIERRNACLFISHDLNVVRYISDRVAVMYRGQIVELAQTDELMSYPQHPYTKLLLAAADLNLDYSQYAAYTEQSSVSSAGCKFAGRCPAKVEHCAKSSPELRELSDEHLVRCWVL